MTVTVTLTFATAAEAASALAALSGNAPAKPQKPAAETAKPAADIQRTAAVEKPAADAPAESAKNYDWDKDVLPALQAYSKKVSRDAFAANIMKAFGIAKVPELKAKPETFAQIMDICNG